MVTDCMKRIITVVLFIILCLSLISCNKLEIPTDITEHKNTNNEENSESETLSPEELKRSKEMAIPLVKDYRIVFPKKSISYIEYRHPIAIDTGEKFPTYTSVPGEVFVFRRQEKITEIISFFEDITLKYAPGMLSSTQNAEHYEIHFTDGTWIGFSICQRTIYGGYLDNEGKDQYWYYWIAPENDMEKLKSIICK